MRHGARAGGTGGGIVGRRQEVRSECFPRERGDVVGGKGWLEGAGARETRSERQGGVMRGWTRKESGRGEGRGGVGLTAGWALACAGPLSVRLGLAGGGRAGDARFLSCDLAGIWRGGGIELWCVCEGREERE